MNDTYRISTFHKNKRFLLCVNSSGTAIQTMEIHHELCYGPSFIEVWNLQEMSDTVQEIWNSINLYEKTRGINRFQALLVILHRINGVFVSEPSLDALRQWLNTSTNISTGDLQREIKINPDPLLQKALRWSERINTKLESIEITDKVPFQFVRETLVKASNHFDIAIISGASQESIIDEWKQHDLLQFVDVIGSQEEGSKSECISRLIQKGYEHQNVIMVGDAIADYEAATQNNALFYPIIIHDEISSWSILKDYYIDKIVHRDFEQFQEALLNMFNNNFDLNIMQPNKN